MSRLPMVAAALTGLIAGGVAFAVPAQEAGEPEDLVEYRQAVMSTLGGHTAAISSILRGKVDVDHLKLHAEGIAATAPAMSDIWWDNSQYDDHDETDALPEIWKEPDRFRNRIEQFQSAADDFVDAVETGERQEIVQGLTDLGDSCSACHDDYRYEE